MTILLDQSWVPEALFHLFESVVTWSVGKVKLSGILWSLIAECQTLVSRQRSVNSIPDTAWTVIASLGCTILELCGGFDGTSISFKIHAHQLNTQIKSKWCIYRFFCVSIEITAVQACIRQISSFAALAEHLIWILKNRVYRKFAFFTRGPCKKRLCWTGSLIKPVFSSMLSVLEPCARATRFLAHP